MSDKTGVDIAALYETVAWPLARKYGHALDAFRISITNPDVWAETSILTTAVADELIAVCKARLTPQALKVRADIEVTCFGYEGIDAIKDTLRAARDTTLEEGEGAGEPKPISVRLVAPPLFVLTCSIIDKKYGVRLLAKAIAAAQDKILEYEGGRCEVKMAPKAVTGKDDDALDALMQQRARENEEVSGDDESSSDAEANEF